jgi:hypothetical protein
MQFQESLKTHHTRTASCGRCHAAQPLVVRHIELMTCGTDGDRRYGQRQYASAMGMRERTIAFVTAKPSGSATEAEHRTAVDGVVGHAKEEVAQQRAIDAIVPGRGRRRQSSAPHIARDLHILLVVQVQEGQRVGRHGRREIDRKATRARAAIPAHTAQHAALEGNQECGLVVRRCVRDERGPVHLAERAAHRVRDTRSGRGNERTPPLTRAAVGECGEGCRSWGGHRWGSRSSRGGLGGFGDAQRISGHAKHVETAHHALDGAVLADKLAGWGAVVEHLYGEGLVVDRPALLGKTPAPFKGGAQRAQRGGRWLCGGCALRRHRGCCIASCACGGKGGQLSMHTQRLLWALLGASAEGPAFGGAQEGFGSDQGGAREAIMQGASHASAAEAHAVRGLGHGGEALFGVSPQKTILWGLKFG